MAKRRDKLFPLTQSFTIKDVPTEYIEMFNTLQVRREREATTGVVTLKKVSRLELFKALVEAEGDLLFGDGGTAEMLELYRRHRDDLNAKIAKRLERELNYD